MKKNNVWALFIVGLIVGMAIGFFINNYQGKTAQQWATLANQNQKWANEWKQMYFTANEKLNTMQNIPVPSPTQPIPQQSYRQNFFSECTFGNIYCTCLYDALHQIDPGNEAIDYIAEHNNGNNAPMINAYAECNSRFNSK